ncbi:MAG: F0F1 ATP synthase subunit epsilon, partial [Candidatus Uhrbacteria bacterium]|nr:F0F1 ATP synthase subunit epsilon [Candidatus Uhrbacteria bacterium]
MSFNLLIQTPDHEAYHGPADLVTLSSDIGEMQILPGHASLLATITYTPIQLRNGGMTMDFILRQGFVFVDQQRNTVRVLGLACEKTEEVNEVTAKEYLAFVLSTLDKPEELNAYQLRHLEGQKLALEKQ